MIVPITEVVAWREDREYFRRRLPPGEYVIGRDPECEIRIDSTRVSRRHARLELRYSDWLIEDLDSSNGTWVGGERIMQPTLLFPRQDVSVGSVYLRLRRAGDGPSMEDSLAPQALAILRFLPAELRDDRRYRVKRLIAMGGMGAVLEAEDAALRRTVAMKVLLGVDKPESIARFVEEAQVTAQLAHPNVVPVYDINVNERDNPFFTMKLLEGKTLHSVLRALQIEEKSAVAAYQLEDLVRILGKVCDAVAFAHAKGVIHRDLKADNVMLGEFGEVVVMDWGLAKPLRPGERTSPVDCARRAPVTSSRQDAGTEFATHEFEVLGTPKAMAPEQAEGDPSLVDTRTDVYALGAILYEMVTLQCPVEGSNTDEILRNVCEGRIRDPREAAEAAQRHWPDGIFPTHLAAVAMKALALEKGSRHQTAPEFQTEVRQAFAADRGARLRATPVWPPAEKR